jgi:hypothetical protein
LVIFRLVVVFAVLPCASMPDSPPMVHNLAEYEIAIKNLKPSDHTHIKLYCGQSDEWELLPNLFRKYRERVDLIHSKEQDALKKLKNRIPWNTPMRPENDWDWLSFGQHYGLWTRMLDWSAKPEIALFFAVETAPIRPTVYDNHAQKQQIVDAETKKRPPAEFLDLLEKTRIMEPSVHSVRVELQKGWHTVHRLHPRKAGGKMVIPLADMEWHKGRVRTISIHPGSAEKIRAELSKKGIRRATVYGEFETVCSSICHECFA